MPNGSLISLDNWNKVMKIPKTLGIRHVALKVSNFAECIHFYEEILGLSLELKTDDYAYLTSGCDNLSLHSVKDVTKDINQQLEHFGFLCEKARDIDDWFDYLKSKISKEQFKDSPHTFGIGTRAFSVFDPSGTEVEFTYHPPMIEKGNK